MTNRDPRVRFGRSGGAGIAEDPEVQLAYLAAVIEASNDAIVHYETVRLTRDGRRLEVSLSISPIKNRAGEVIGASKIARDITARKLADEQLLAATANIRNDCSLPP